MSRSDELSLEAAMALTKSAVEKAEVAVEMAEVAVALATAACLELEWASIRCERRADKAAIAANAVKDVQERVLSKKEVERLQAESLHAKRALDMMLKARFAAEVARDAAVIVRGAF